MLHFILDLEEKNSIHLSPVRTLLSGVVTWATGLADCLFELHCPVTAMLADGACQNIVNHRPVPCAWRRSSVYKGSAIMSGKSESPENRETKANGAAKEEQRQAAPMSQRGPVQHSTISAGDRLTGNLISGGDITVEGTAEEGFARAAGIYSTRIEQTLGMIETIEKNLREKRKRIEEIQTRHKDLALQYGQLGKSLDSATADLAQQFAGVITDLGNDGAISKLPVGGAPATVFFSKFTPKNEDDGTTAGPETDTEPVIRPSDAVSEDAPTLAEDAKDKPGHEAKEEAKSDLTIAEVSNLYVAQGCTAEKSTTLVTDEARTPRSKGRLNFLSVR